MALAEIRTKLEELIDENTGDGKIFNQSIFMQRDFIFERDRDNIASFPCVIMSSPSFTSRVLDTATNVREYEFEMIVLANADENIDALKEKVADMLDRARNLDGAADGDVLPSVTPSTAATSLGQDLEVFSVIVTASSTSSSV